MASSYVPMCIGQQLESKAASAPRDHVRDTGAGTAIIAALFGTDLSGSHHKGVRYSLLVQVPGTVFLPKAWHAIIRTQEVVRDEITRDRAIPGRARGRIKEPGQKDEAETIEYSLHVLFGPESESEQ